MKTVLELIRKAGGWHPGLYLKIDNPPYMELVIEAMDESGRCGLPAVSVAHYGEQNGDAMRYPEMCFELGLAEAHSYRQSSETRRSPDGASVGFRALLYLEAPPKASSKLPRRRDSLPRIRLADRS